MQLQGKHVLITGAAKRLGRALADHCLAEGARVTAHSHATPWPGHESARVQNLKADLRRPEAAAALVERARASFGPIAVLINSASDFFSTPDGSVEGWDALFALNARAPFLLARACLEEVRAERGCILNLCDIHVTKPLAHFGAYSASKGALWTLTRVLAREAAPHARVNSISPGPVLPPDSFSPEQRERAASRTLLGRLGSPADIVGAARFLLGNYYVTGFDLVVDGGASLTGS
jgi:pteridine reductase